MHKSVPTRMNTAKPHHGALEDDFRTKDREMTSEQYPYTLFELGCCYANVTRTPLSIGSSSQRPVLVEEYPA